MNESITQEEAFHRITDLLRCKWSLGVLDAISVGHLRPSQIQRSLDGLTPKVMYQRLHKLERFGLIQRRVIGTEQSPHTEYVMTDRGLQVVSALLTLRNVAEQWATPAE